MRKHTNMGLLSGFITIFVIVTTASLLAGCVGDDGAAANAVTTQESAPPGYLIVIDSDGNALDIFKHELPDDYIVPDGAVIVDAVVERRLVDWNGDGETWVYVDEIMAPVSPGGPLYRITLPQ